MHKPANSLGGDIQTIASRASIGGGICKELVNFLPQRLIAIDISENNLFRFLSELKNLESGIEVKETEIIYKIMDIRNRYLVEKLLQDYSVDYLIHTAALKHVPFCEENLSEAISVNVGGTLTLMNLAKDKGVKKFIYISTDKAVEPISVMGATKRIGELLIKIFSQDKNSLTRFISVRFGNVIGSSGNVIEVFSQQLQAHKPLTITAPEMSRFFMSLEEAVKLILEVIWMGQEGQTFVLDMGKPIRIKDLAYDMALFYGKRLRDEDIIYIGKRRGEKIEEKLWGAQEKVFTTAHPKIFRVEEEAPDFALLERVNFLLENVYNLKEEELRDLLFSTVRLEGTRGFKDV